MICLGVEATAHTLGVGIIDEEGEVLANEKDVYTPEKGWGIKPGEAAEHHKEVKEEVLDRALKKAEVEGGEVDLISISQGPGLPPCLQEGLSFAKGLSERWDKPLVGVAHTVAHLEIGKLETQAKDPITLYVSGGNTQVIGFSRGKYRVFGETLDTAIGNALDKFAREAGLEHPGGPKIEELAEDGSQYLQLPYSVKGMDLSFSGLTTEATRKLKEGAKLPDLCYSFQETAFAMLTEVVERAAAHAGKDEVLLTGGVAANQRLQDMLEEMCEERGASFYAVPGKYAGDNGAMIAWTGILTRRGGKEPLNLEEASIEPNWRTDEVEVGWR